MVHDARNCKRGHTALAHVGKEIIHAEINHATCTEGMRTGKMKAFISLTFLLFVFKLSFLEIVLKYLLSLALHQDFFVIFGCFYYFKLLIYPFYSNYTWNEYFKNNLPFSFPRIGKTAAVPVL